MPIREAIQLAHAVCDRRHLPINTEKTYTEAGAGQGGHWSGSPRHGLSGVPNPNPRHNRHRPDWQRRVKHHLFNLRQPADGVPRIIALPNPSAASRSFVKLEHVLAIVRVEE